MNGVWGRPSGGGSGVGDVGVSRRDAICLSSDLVGNVVYIAGPSVGGLMTVETADITSQSKMPAIGVVFSKSSDTRCKIHLFGDVDAPNVLATSDVWVSPTGKMTHIIPSNPPVNTIYIRQRLGTAPLDGLVLFRPTLSVTVITS